MSLMKTTKRTAESNWQWLVLWLGLILSALYSRPPIPVDETRYLSVAWDMWQNNEFLVPHINGVPYSQKPPLFFWAIHLFWWLFGVGEWQARLVAPIFGLISVGLTGQLARMLWPADRDVAAISPFMLLGCSIWALLSSLTMFDTLLTCCCLLVFRYLLEAEREGTIFPWVWISLFLGLGVLAKGPVMLVYVVPPMLLAPWWSDRHGRSWRWWCGRAMAAIAGAIALALCWAIPAAIQGGAEYARDILLGQTSGRIMRAFAHQKPFYWYALVLPLFLFPWILWRPVWLGWRGFLHERSSRFCLAVILPGFFLLSCISAKQIHYFLPLLPLFALAFARMANYRISEIGPLDRWPVVLPLLLLGIALFILMQFSPLGKEGGKLAFLPVWLGVIPILSSLPLLFFRSPLPVKSVKIIAASYLLFCIFLHLSLTVPLHNRFQPTEIGEGLRITQENSRKIAVFPPKLSQQLQFAGHLIAPLLLTRSWDELALWAHAHPDEYCLFFTDNPAFLPLAVNSVISPYKEGWLVLRPARDFFESYRLLAAQLQSRKLEPAADL